jgi:hypothetical protein
VFGAGILLAATQVLVTVLDPLTGFRLPGLGTDDFVASGGIDSVRVADRPMAVLLLVDSSVTGEVVRTTAERLIGELATGDQMALMTFSRNTSFTKDFTADRAALREALAGVSYGGDPRMLDGLAEGLGCTFPVGPLRKVVVLLTAGIEGPSRTLESTVIRAAREKGIAIYPVYLHGSGRWVFPEIARATGGASFWLREAGNVTGIWETIRQPYLLKLHNAGGTIKTKGREKTFVSSLPLVID